MSRKDLVAVFFGTGLGGVCRYLMGQIAVLQPLGLATLVVNYLGTFVLVFVVQGYLPAKKSSKRLILALGTGFCGGFTSFSTAMLELFRYLERGEILSFIAYGIALFIGGLLVTYIAHTLARRVYRDY
ncbi:fluoride efflux transporter FluC [Streptococcus sp. zg-JUN1979]|uniref:fluoride efflux transporter FluC n=1 Tax=Streptococcus sp. zg-JUN1979 TaxID=3391450 RepID=UPI0039A709C9